MSSPENEIPEPAPAVGVPRLVLPTRCGRYHWDDEPVVVWLEDGEMWGAAPHVGIEKVEDIDREFRTENSLQHIVSLDAPWLRVGDCYRDDCECAGPNDQMQTTPESTPK
jgi:hypothetical protein